MLMVGFHSEDLVGHMQKVDPKQISGLDRFDFVRWYVDKEVERLVSWGCKVNLIDVQ